MPVTNKFWTWPYLQLFVSFAERKTADHYAAVRFIGIFKIFTGVNTEKVLNEGLHIVPKIFNKVTIYDVYTKTWEENINCLSSDGLPMEMHVSIR